MELSNDNLLIITDLPACQISTQMIGSVVLALCAPVFCFVVRPQQSERTTAVAKQSGGRVLWIHVVTQQSTFIVATPLGSSSSSSHLRTPRFRDPGQQAERGVAEHIESSCKCYTTWEENCAGLKEMAAFTTIQVGQDKKTERGIKLGVYDLNEDKFKFFSVFFGEGFQSLTTQHSTISM